VEIEKRFTLLYLRAFFLIGSLASLALAQEQDTLLLKAQFLQRQGKLSDAVQYLSQALLSQTTHHEARILYARYLGWQQQWKEARTHYEVVLRAVPHHPDARFGLSQILAWTGQLDSAIAYLRPLIAEHPRNSEYRTLLGNIWLWRGETGEAERHFRDAIRLDTANVDATRGLARIARRSNRFEEASQWYRRVLVFEPLDVEARVELRRMAYQSTLEIHFGSTLESFNREGRSSHSIYSTEVYYEIDNQWKPFAHFSRISKFGSTATQFGGGIYFSPAHGTSLFAQVLGSSISSVMPQWDANTELNQSLFGSLEGIIGYRLLSFASSSAFVISPGVTWYLRGNAWTTPRVYLARSRDGSTSRSFVCTFFYQLDDFTRLRIGGVAGAETFRATTLQEIVETSSAGGFLGFQTRLSRSFALNGQYLFTSDKEGLRSHQFILFLALLF
jgi:YaiO family outer membrane protein